MGDFSNRGVMVDRLADVIVRYSTGVKPGDLVSIQADPIALPLIEALTERIVAAGGHPYWQCRCESIEQILIETGTDEQIAYITPIDKFLFETVDVRIALWAETNTRSLSSVDPAKSSLRVQARRPLMETSMRRFNEGSLRWCGTLFPTQASAQDAEMSLRQYEQFVYEAGKLHLPDPVAAWRQVHDRQQILRDWLQGREEVRFFVPPHDGHDGTNLRVRVADSTWINCSGHENFPDGEVFAGPQGADGYVNYTYPALHSGRAVEGVRLEFKGGRVVNAGARKDEAYLVKMLDQDEGARNMGEIAIGTNYDIPSFSRNTLFDEKIGGTFHAAVGAGYPESGSSNQSGLHWDMVCELRPAPGRPGGTIEADGEVFSRDGEILIAGWSR